MGLPEWIIDNKANQKCAGSEELGSKKSSKWREANEKLARMGSS